MQKRTVIVTGGAGFIGSNLARALLESENYIVHVIDSLVAGKAEAVPKGAILHVCDIRHELFLRRVFEKIAAGAAIDGVFHLAALPRVQFSIDHHDEAHSANVDGLKNVLDAAAAVGAKKFVYSASSSAYGDQATLPLHEGMVPNPMSPYALQKYFGEHLVRNYALHGKLGKGMRTVSLRYFNVAGPGADPNGSYPQFIVKSVYRRMNGQTITVTGDGLQTRDTVHVRDVGRANIMAFESRNVGKGEVMNIGSGKARSVLDMAKMIGGEVEFIAPRVEPKHTLADISLAKELIGWEPRITLEELIAELKKEYGIE